MAVIHGRKGVVKYKTKTLANIDNWQLNVESDLPEVTAFSTAGVSWRAYAPGLNSWSGSVSGFLDEVGDSSGQAVILTNLLTPATGTIKLYLDDSGGEDFYGNVYWKSVNVNVSVDSIEPVVFNFQGNGALTYSTTG
jgi:hypothetical protein